MGKVCSRQDLESYVQSKHLLHFWFCYFLVEAIGEEAEVYILLEAIGLDNKHTYSLM